jgi:AcrR family transcriptional regulator
VIARAVALADEEGLDALTIRRLATDFGVTAMALYWHFKNKDELLDGIAEHLFGSVALPAPAASPGEWADELHALLTAVVSAFRLHASVAVLAQARILTGDVGLTLVERTLGLLDDAGFTCEQAAEISGYLLNAVVTLITAEPGSGHGTDPAEHDKTARARKATLLTLSPQRYPHIIAAAGPLTTCENDDAYYARGLDLLIAGVQGLRDKNS